MKTLALALLALAAGCGSEDDGVTSQGVLVDDLTGTFSVAEVEAAIALVYELAPEKYHEAFAQLDGYQLTVLAAKSVEQCSTKNMRAGGCVIYETSLIVIGNKTCGDYRGKVSVLAHEIGHVLTGPTHDNDDFYAAMGVADRAQLAECGKIPTP